MTTYCQVETTYADIDTLLDIRYSAGCHLNKEATDNFVDSGKYFSRLDDVFPGIDPDKLKKAINKPGNFYLKNSLMTNLVFLIAQLFRRRYVETFQIGLPIEQKLVVNMFPFSVSQEEMSDLAMAIGFHMPDNVEVTVTYIDKKDMTTKYCHDNFSFMYMYNYYDWLEMQTKSFEEFKIPGVSLFVPALFFKKKPDEKEAAMFTGMNMDPFALMAQGSQLLISLEHIDVKYFCIIKYDVIELIQTF